MIIFSQIWTFTMFNFQDLKVKTCVLNQDSAVQLSKTSLDAEHVGAAIGHLHMLTDILLSGLYQIVEHL